MKRNQGSLPNSLRSCRPPRPPISIELVKDFTLLDDERIFRDLYLLVADAAGEIKTPIRAALVLENVMEGK